MIFIFDPTNPFIPIAPPNRFIFQEVPNLFQVSKISSRDGIPGIPTCSRTSHFVEFIPHSLTGDTPLKLGYNLINMVTTCYYPLNRILACTSKYKVVPRPTFYELVHTSHQVVRYLLAIYLSIYLSI